LGKVHQNAIEESPQRWISIAKRRKNFHHEIEGRRTKNRENEVGVQNHHQGKQLKDTLEGGTCWKTSQHTTSL